MRRRFAGGDLSVRQLGGAIRRVIGELAAARRGPPALDPIAALEAELATGEERPKDYAKSPGRLGFHIG